MEISIIKRYHDYVVKMCLVLYDNLLTKTKANLINFFSFWWLII